MTGFKTLPNQETPRKKSTGGENVLNILHGKEFCLTKLLDRMARINLDSANH